MFKKTKLFLTQFISYVLRLVLSSLFFSSTLFFNSVNAGEEHYTAYAKNQEQKAKELIAPYKAEVEELVKNALAKQAQPDIQSFKKEITGAVKTKCPYQDQKETEISPQSSNTTPILIFVSFSMPKESIKGWIADAKKAEAAIYIRGLVNNSFKDTAKSVRELVQDQPGGLLIDPTLFKKYSIMQVPAVVVTSGDDFDVIYGDATLDYALEKISKTAQAKQQKYLLGAIKKLRDKKSVEAAKGKDI